MVVRWLPNLADFLVSLARLSENLERHRDIRVKKQRKARRIISIFQEKFTKGFS